MATGAPLSVTAAHVLTTHRIGIVVPVGPPDYTPLMRHIQAQSTIHKENRRRHRAIGGRRKVVDLVKSYGRRLLKSHYATPRSAPFPPSWYRHPARIHGLLGRQPGG